MQPDTTEAATTFAGRDEPPASTWRERLESLLRLGPREVAALAVLVVAIVAGAGIAFVRARPKPEPAAAHRAVEVIGTPTPDATATAALVVHVAGAVLRAGVFTLPPGSRVADAIAAAGGAAPGADVNSINLARPLGDGERVWIPRKGETPPPDPGDGSPGSGGGASGSTGGKVNINTASAAELETLPGIGPALAERIVAYRTQHGPFRAIRDLMKVSGIGEKKFAALQDHVTI